MTVCAKVEGAEPKETEAKTTGAIHKTNSPPAKRIFISTGEVSGDLHGSLLIDALQKRAANTNITLDIAALGGERMAATGVNMLGKTDAIGSIGLLEALPFIWSTYRVQQLAKRWLVDHPPDLIIMIDYLAPNLSIGNFARQRFPKTPTVFYIAPQEWVWSLGSRNTSTLVSITDRLLAIFPKEATYYRERGANVTWVGHPLVDWVKRFPSRQEARQQLNILDEQTAIALLPASRRQELTYLMPVIFETAQRIQAQIPNAHFWIPLALDAYRPQIEQAIAQYQLNATLVTDDTKAAIAAADFAISKSGTVNLELALMDIPQLVLYRVNPFTAWVAGNILNFSVPFVSPPNLVLMEPIVPEFLQNDANPETLTQTAMALLTDAEAQQTMRQNYARMRASLGAAGVCDRAAHSILELLVSQS
ncbi:MAG: lipid-A-disaccharide synthase [Merismopedia sp. SIO2A8]|nr:lipid-A-disaccharide synthase [Merismopedia sp. SIO2A8]